MSQNKPAILGGSPLLNSSQLPWPPKTPGIEQAFQRLLSSGDWGRYDSAESLSLMEDLKAFNATDHITLCSSGTAAMELALRGIGLQNGEEVLLSAYDFKSNFTNICLLGAVPVLIDLDENAQLDAELLKQALTPKTKAIVISPLHGGFPNLAAIRTLATENQLSVIIDSCQCPGAQFQHQPMSHWGEIEIWSFGGSKLLTSGRGGAVMTKSREIHERISRYQQRGNLAYPLSEMQAAVLKSQLAELKQSHSIRHRHVTQLTETTGKHDFPFVCPSAEECQSQGHKPVFYKLGCWLPEAISKQLSRDQFIAAMRAEGIPIAAGFRSLHLIHSQRRYHSPFELSQASKADEQLLQLHHTFLWLNNAAEVWNEALSKILDHHSQIAQLPAQTIQSQLPQLFH